MWAALVGLSLLVAPPPPPSPPPARCSTKALTAALGREAAPLAIELPLGSVAPGLAAVDGRLSTAACGGPAGKATLVQLLDDHDVDFRVFAKLSDGRLVFGATGGLIALDPMTLAKTRLTTAPEYGAEPEPGKRACWTAEPGKPVVGWDRNPRLAQRPERVVFDRGAHCGFEAEATNTTMVVDIASGAIQAVRDVPALVVTRNGLALLGDGNPGCEETQSDGRIWVSIGGWPFVPLTVDADLHGGVVALAEADDGALWAVAATCGNGGATVGGDVYRAAPGTLTWQQVEVASGPDDEPIDRGAGASAVAVRGAEVLIGRGPKSWQSTKDGGKTWKTVRFTPRPAKVPKDLAASIGVRAVHGVVATANSELAFTSDGAYARPKPTRDSPWTRVFPNP